MKSIQDIAGGVSRFINKKSKSKTPETTCRCQNTAGAQQAALYHTFQSPLQSGYQPHHSQLQPAYAHHQIFQQPQTIATVPMSPFAHHCQQPQVIHSPQPQQQQAPTCALQNGQYRSDASLDSKLFNTSYNSSTNYSNATTTVASNNHNAGNHAIAMGSQIQYSAPQAVALPTYQASQLQSSITGTVGPTAQYQSDNLYYNQVTTFTMSPDCNISQQQQQHHQLDEQVHQQQIMQQQQLMLKQQRQLSETQRLQQQQQQQQHQQQQQYQNHQVVKEQTMARDADAGLSLEVLCYMHERSREDLDARAKELRRNLDRFSEQLQLIGKEESPKYSVCEARI